MNRVIAAVRKNGDYCIAERLAEELGYALRVEPARGRGHPRAVFEGGSGSFSIPIASSPGGRNSLKKTRAMMISALRRAGMPEVA